jgi:hypothetical protein
VHNAIFPIQLCQLAGPTAAYAATDPTDAENIMDPTSIPGIGGISGDLPRQGGGGSMSRSRAKAVILPGRREQVADDPGQPSAPPADDPTTTLVQALDRLRATAELRPAETEVVRAMRGVRHYQEESRHGLPVISDPDHPLDDGHDQPSPPDRIA